MFVRTERMFLRPAWPEDLDDLVEILGEEGVQCTVGVSPLLRDVAGIAAFLNRSSDPRLPHLVMYLRAPDGPRLVGGIALAADEDGGVEISYWIVARYRGRGFAREALRAVMNQARALGYRRVVAKHFAEGLATHRVLESVGFADTGKVHSRYSNARGMEFAARTYVADLATRPWHGLPDADVIAPAPAMCA
ncbi:GCN5-like N-acetyltransferase [Novosphingobium sp. Rr 2-17]|uniref:GNAT family N-acetyltransferase n=1 Tax=Novosphingobium sp. Rr 2-17 TaxID=555793 RepID=UPI000269A515|nr:GNAT family protein [Novosphingobium sp. Rr 2-17]EIZ78847.1 GCN5-like N-acetyltransferase [Novosphingobium sp. Rr 2-17]